MARLLIHGVPDTPAMWGPLLDALGPDAGEVHTPAMPGFGQPAPADFPATMHAYADWLAERVDRLYADSGPVDLVGHDWGALLTLRVAHVRAAKIRTWAALNGAFDDRYGGHFLARVWATPVLGELSMLLPGSAGTAAILRACGVPRAHAAETGRRVDRTMKRCILRLYRSARGLRDLGPWLAGLGALPRAGLLVWGDRDPFLPVDLAERVSARAGVPLHVERGAGHWTPVVRPAAVAEALRRLWSRH